MQIAADFKRMTVDFLQAFKNRQDTLRRIGEFVRALRQATQELRSKNQSLINANHKEHREIQKVYNSFRDAMRHARK